jgi:two-component system capsular synthesis sensor histidine kinase RcsC
LLEGDAALPVSRLAGKAVVVHCRDAETQRRSAILAAWGAAQSDGAQRQRLEAAIHLVAPDCVDDFIACAQHQSLQAVLICPDVVRRGSLASGWQQVSAFDRHGWRCALSRPACCGGVQPAVELLRGQRTRCAGGGG